MKHIISNIITDFTQVNWNELGNIKIVYCYDNQLTSFNGLSTEVTELHCGNNQITSFVGLSSSVMILDCNDNKLTSFNGLPSSVKRLFCGNNQITSFNGLPLSVKRLSCNFNKITSFDDLYYLPNELYSDIGTPTLEKINENRLRKGKEIIGNIRSHFRVTLLKRHWIRYWYNTIVYYEGCEINRYGRYCMKNFLSI